jgi:hypothetical protein
MTEDRSEEEMMGGRCIGYPRHSCRATNGYAKAKARAWMCSKCREKRTKVWQVKHI